MDNAGGSDKLYKGAELEYLFTGSNSEKGAQVGTFFNIFLVKITHEIFLLLQNQIGFRHQALQVLL